MTSMSGGGGGGGGGWRRHATLLIVAFLVLQASEISYSRPISKGEKLRHAVDRTVRELRRSHLELQPGGSGGGGFKNLFKSRLPRGPVPPSGPSPCHNYYRLLNFTTNEYISCP
ncbi:hypothetical protein SAY87_001933 [Trapa incisa]|uniref:Uncharacterized protein n=1 Tax=Trapa incisa TaxID=236973 RepID=A0AAN7PU22_9MYRT|nr:hypothetical protein SAY87_001933 [Trapa incisa]